MSDYLKDNYEKLRTLPELSLPELDNTLANLPKGVEKLEELENKLSALETSKRELVINNLLNFLAASESVPAVSIADLDLTIGGVKVTDRGGFRDLFGDNFKLL